jgi:DNA-binding beta-propeller fold protein YncE
MDASTDAFITSIPVGAYPSEMSASASALHPKLFVTCEEDSLNFSGKRGSVFIIDMNDYSTDTIYTGWQPHGLVVDDAKNLVMVANRNQTTGGPAPHHSTCGGRDGYVTFIDMSQSPMKLLKVNGKTKSIEVSVDPYSIALRHN